MCRVLEVSTSGYYAWQKRPASKRAQEDGVLLRRIRTIHEASRQSYGVPRVYEELRDDGVAVGRDRVARLMRRAGLQGKVVGWKMATHLRTELVLEALHMAIQQRRPASVIHHSDQGCQYTSVAFGKRCEQLGVRPSMGSVGDAYDNAMAESFFATLECELLDRTRFRTQAEARMAVFEWIEGWYNPQRRHSSIGYLSPIEFERRHAAAGELGGSAPEPPFMMERRGDQEGPGIESAQPSTEPR
jgi:transposase InsO family protein